MGNETRRPVLRVAAGILVAGALGFALSACSDRETPPVGAAREPADAVAKLEPTRTGRVHGTVEFEAAGPGEEGLRVRAKVLGLPPGRHAFHVHEHGDCSAPDASSAGDHYNPLGAPHGAPGNDDDARHAGDLGNVEADASGTVEAQIEDLLLKMENSLVGRAVIVHSDEDDLASQPSGASGDPLACGVLRGASGDEPGQSRAESEIRPERIGG